jgi:CopG family transcriptional regulator, nickel-responsive regulator
MQRITITIDDELAQEIDKLAQLRGYQNRSETVRDLVRAGIAHTRPESFAAAECVASVIYVYEQGIRELPKRLANAYQLQHDLSVATLRVALDHDSCMEVAVLKGKTAEVERFAGEIMAERGVRHGRVVLIPAEIESERHSHGERRAHAHQHIKVR